MRALFEKDLRLILIRKSSLFIFLIIGIVFTWNFSSSFSGAYLTMLGMLLALSTISYDDSDNCMAFLFTLPCTRRQYVYEKYMFIYGFSFVAGIIGLVIVLIASLLKGEAINSEMVVDVLVSEIPILVITGGIMIPLQLKYGPEKARIVLISIIGLLFAIGAMINKIWGLEEALTSIDEALNAMNYISIIVAFLVVLVISSVISLQITRQIITKKEY